MKGGYFAKNLLNFAFNKNIAFGLATTITTMSSLYYFNSLKNPLIAGVKEKDLKDPLYRSKNKMPLGDDENVLIFGGSSNKLLAEEVAERLGHKLGKANISRFADGECNIQIFESIRGKDIYIIQPTCPPVNENLVELLLMISTFKRTSAKKITAIIPYYGYGRADRKMNSRVPISAADTAKMLETMGVDRVMAIDLHAGQIQGFFGPSIPVDNLESQIVMVESLLNSDMVKDFNNLVIVSPDAGGVYRAKSFAEILSSKTGANVGLTMIVKQRVKANEISKMELVGNVKNQECIIIDDIIDTAGTLCAAAGVLKENGATNVMAFATHGLFSKDAIDKINKSDLDKVVVTNTIPYTKEPSNKIHILSVGTLIAEAIRRIYNNESLSAIFPRK